MYNAAISTTHAVTTHAIFFKLCLVIRGYIFLQPRYLHEAVSYTSVGSYVITHPGVMKDITSLSLCGSYPRLPGREKLWTTASFPYLGAGRTQLQPMRSWYFSRTSDVTLGDYRRA